ncbi:hypothetical protein BN946_scf184325.g16 [Trametes cinnabarina]|uniref:Uncharacterized protein n=1 Tax=Pycnoporus cinnabarinus TaxID=5643 RepID=A0A060SQX2_PYCCI|nr:hypothetical protein BN946_scf184325.g16 [Trametes cinnabarina]
MLPPALPSKATSSMPVRPIRPPRSSSSDKWVPSSQTRELSLSPRKDWKLKGNSGSLPHTPVDHATQVVPSSQSNERELQLPDLPSLPDVCRTPDSPLRMEGSPLSPLLPLEGTGPDPLDGRALAAGLPSPQVVESSQSQFENDISSAWAETISARHAALTWSNEGEEAGTPSSPNRPVDSQGYDANDEYSQFQDTSSQPSTSTPSELIKSPFRTPSRRRGKEPAESYPVEPYLRTPSQLRDFVQMFDKRDELGNPLSSGEEESEAHSRPVSPSPSPSTRRAAPSGHGQGMPGTILRTKRRMRHASPPSSYAERPPRSRRRGSEEDLDPSQQCAEDFHPDSISDSSSSVWAIPTPAREFLDMYDESQDSQAPL